jgi:dUTP pyrophosphatase
LPRKATSESIGTDVYAYLKTESGRANKLVIPPNTTRVVPTGLVVLAQPPFSILVCSRSGLAAERTLFVTNAPGVIDPDYRGEVKILLHNAGVQNQWIEHNDRIAQLILCPIPIPDISESELDLRHLDTERGENGFGSTGR